MYGAKSDSQAVELKAATAFTTDFVDTGEISCHNLAFIDFLLKVVDAGDGAGVITIRALCKEDTSDEWFYLMQESSGALSIYELTIDPTGSINMNITLPARASKLKLQIKAAAAAGTYQVWGLRRVGG